MLDASPCDFSDVPSDAVIDDALLACDLANLSDRELAALGDDLDFCNFTGVPSTRLLKFLSGMIELDKSWSAQLLADQSLEVPKPDFSNQRPAVKRANRNSRGFQPLAHCA